MSGRKRIDITKQVKALNKLVKAHGDVTRLADEYGVAYQTLRLWRRKVRAGERVYADAENAAKLGGKG